MKALYRRRLTTDELLSEVACGRKQLFKAIKGLKEIGMVANKGDRKGYYRPDAPPPLVDDAPSQPPSGAQHARAGKAHSHRRFRGYR